MWGTASSVIIASTFLTRKKKRRSCERLQDAETGATFHTETAWACFCAAGVAFRAQSYIGVKRRSIGSSWNVFGLAGAACDFAGHGIFSYNRETFFKMQSESSTFAIDDGADSFGSKKLAGCRDGRDFLYKNGMGLLLRGWRGFPRPIAQRGETAAYRFKQKCFRACGGGEILRGTAFSTITGKLFPKCRAKVVLLRQLMAQILSVQKSWQDAETGATFYTRTAWACFCAAGVAFRAQSYIGVKRRSIGSSWDVFGLAGAARFDGV